MFYAILAMAALTDTAIPRPPYKRLVTVTVFADSYNPAVAIDKDLFITGSFANCAAYDLRTMKKLWSVTPFKGEGNETISIQNGTVYVTTNPDYQKKSSHLVALNEKTGKTLWQVSRSGEGSPMAFGKGVVYVSLQSNHLSALNLATHRPKWTATFPSSKEGGMMSEKFDAVVAKDNTVVANLNSVTYAVDAATGKNLWKQDNSYILNGGLPTLGSVVWIPSDNGSLACDLRTGKVLWRKPDVHFGDYGGVFEGMFVGISNGQIMAVDPKSGKVAWSHEVGPKNSSGGYQFGAVFGHQLYVRGMNQAGLFDKSGKELWKGPSEDSIPEPCWTNGRELVCFDGKRLIRYSQGKEDPQPTTPAGRAALAQRLVDHFGELDAGDIKRLEALGDYAFDPVLKAFLKACDAYDAKVKDSSMDLYDRYHSLGDVLSKVTSKNDTRPMMEALGKAKAESSCKPMLLTLLGQFGDPKDVTPYFIKELERTKTPGFEMYESNTYVARTYIASSSDPRAVAFMIKQLQNPKADETLKFEAYTHLAGTGGAEGLKAVVAARNQRTLLRPISDRALSGFLNAGEFGAKAKTLGEKSDAQGRTWGLFQSGVLGSQGDLWLAERVNGTWSHALFIGVSTSGVSRWAKPQPPEPKFAGKTAKELVDGAWFTTLVGNADLAKDSDGDGLTDIEEKRLGLDSSKTDTDGDGDSDGVDPWPNAPNRTDLSDAEQLLAAAFEARYHGDDGEGPGLFFAVEGMKPFEMPGRKGPMLWVPEKGASDWSLPLAQCYEQGVAFIRFGEMSRDVKKPWEERIIAWNADHTEGRVSISTYFGGLNGTGYDVVVRKFGSDWVVVSMRMAYVS